MDALEPPANLRRRTVLVAGAGAALGMTALAACGSDDSGGPVSAAGSSAAGPSSSGGAAASGALAKVADIPVGGAVSATDAAGKPVIVSQPTAGKVVAFSAICTHMGCTVAPADSILKCPCHGSTYDLATGDNTGGPAPKPLTEIPVRVKGGEVVEA
jgi:Rieske Fe-S protein